MFAWQSIRKNSASLFSPLDIVCLTLSFEVPKFCMLFVYFSPVLFLFFVSYSESVLGPGFSFCLFCCVPFFGVFTASGFPVSDILLAVIVCFVICNFYGECHSKYSEYFHYQ